MHSFHTKKKRNKLIIISWICWWAITIISCSTLEACLLFWLNIHQQDGWLFFLSSEKEIFSLSLSLVTQQWRNESLNANWWEGKHLWEKLLFVNYWLLVNCQLNYSYLYWLAVFAVESELQVETCEMEVKVEFYKTWWFVEVVIYWFK